MGRGCHAQEGNKSTPGPISSVGGANPDISDWPFSLLWRMYRHSLASLTTKVMVGRRVTCAGLNWSGLHSYMATSVCYYWLHKVSKLMFLFHSRNLSQSWNAWKLKQPVLGGLPQLCLQKSSRVDVTCMCKSTNRAAYNSDVHDSV